MSNLKEIKGRIASVQSTQKITSAMRMVSSAKLHHTQQLTQNYLLYQNELEQIATALGCLNKPTMSDAPTATPPTSIALVPVSSGSGLCGAFNSNLIKETLATIQEYHTKGISVTVVPVGKKVAQYLNTLSSCGKDFMLNPDFVATAEESGRKGGKQHSDNLFRYLQQASQQGRFQCVEVIYHHFISMGKQVVTHHIIDFSLPSLPPTRPAEREFILEPSPEQLVEALHPQMLSSKVYSIMLDSLTSEHAARMMAMQTADDNAQELLQELTLLYNKSRQQSITNELIDIMGGKVVEQ